MVGRVLLLYVVALATALFVCRVEAAAVPLQVGAGVVRSAVSSTGYLSTASATSWAGAAYNSGMTTQVGGRLVTVPASWRLAANAGQVALGAIRATPQGAAASAALSILIGIGIQKCLNGTIGWCVPGSTEQAPNGKPYPRSQFYGVVGGGKWLYADSPGVLCQMFVAATNASGVNTVSMIDAWTTSTGGICKIGFPSNPNASPSELNLTRLGGACGNTTDTYQVSTGMCVPAGYVAPADERAATDSDWGKVSPNTITASDVILNALGRDGVALDIRPEFQPNPQTVPLSNPYTDPVTGKRFQDIATVQPNPDGKTAEVQVAKQEVDANGNPAQDASGVPAAPQKQEDPCVGHEDRLGCMGMGEIPQGPDLGKDERTITITPDTGWGSDTAACPADIVAPLRTAGAQPAVFSYQPLCKAADNFRPVILGLAWLGAIFIALGAARKGDE